MAYTTIDDPSKYFEALLYTSDGEANRDISGLDFQPDWVWIKDRANPGTTWHHHFDSSRGANKPLNSNVENAEGSVTTFPAFNSDGFQVNGGNLNQNNNTQTNVAWCWKANGGTTSSFTESSNNPGGTIQTNTTAGFSIITSTGTGGAGTIAHGLGAVPHFIISKGRSNSGGWVVYHQGNTSAPETDALNLSSTAATSDSSVWFNDTAPTSSVFTLGTTNDVNGDARTYIHYVFTPIQGYSKFDSYVGNGSTNGPFVYTGFKPAWLIVKESDGTGQWRIRDNKRFDQVNPIDKVLYANATTTETDEDNVDFLSNGFKIRTSGGENNGSGDNYIYMAFAENPFVSSTGIPCTAR